MMKRIVKAGEVMEREALVSCEIEAQPGGSIRYCSFGAGIEFSPGEIRIDGCYFDPGARTLAELWDSAARASVTGFGHLAP